MVQIKVGKTYILYILQFVDFKTELIKIKVQEGNIRRQSREKGSKQLSQYSLYQVVHR